MSLFPETFYKYCNCYNSYNKINAECFDTVEDAIESYNNIDKSNKIESKLVLVNKYYPLFLQKKIIQIAFIKPETSLYFINIK